MALVVEQSGYMALALSIRVINSRWKVVAMALRRQVYQLPHNNHDLNLYTCGCIIIIINILCVPFTTLAVVEGSGGGGGDCIFAEDSPLYSESFRSSMEPLDRLVPSCEDLESFWKHLVSLMSLSIMGLLVSLVAIVINCVTPCVEDRQDSISWYPKTDV